MSSLRRTRPRRSVSRSCDFSFGVFCSQRSYVQQLLAPSSPLRRCTLRPLLSSSALGQEVGDRPSETTAGLTDNMPESFTLQTQPMTNQRKKLHTANQHHRIQHGINITTKTKKSKCIIICALSVLWKKETSL